MFEKFKYDLRHNRKSVTRAVTAWLIFGAIILVFVFAELNPNRQGVAEGGTAAEVNGEIISLAEYSQALERMRRDPRFEQLQALGGDAGRQMMQQQTIAQLVDSELIRQAAERNRLLTTDAEVRDVIFNIPQFQEQGQFKPSIYRATLEANRLSPAQFEEDIRNDQSRQRAFRLFSTALKPLKIEDEKVKELSSMKANVEFVSVPTENLVMPESINEGDVKAFLAQAGNDTKVKDYYESHKEEFSTPERVKVRHILVRAQAGDAEAEKKALAKIQDIAAKAKSGDFAKLASQFSEDPGSKANGGLIDFFARGKMVPEFEQVAFSQAPNTISAPVKTEYGYHLIQVLEKRPASSRNLEEAREEIASTLIAKERSRVAVDALNEMLKKGDDAGVRKFVTDHKLKWEETGAFSIDSDNVPNIGPNEEVVRQAFSLTAEKPLANALVREGGRALIVRHKAVPAEKTPAVKEPKNDLMAEMMASRRSEETIRRWVDGMKKDAKISMNPRVLNQ